MSKISNHKFIKNSQQKTKKQAKKIPKNKKNDTAKVIFTLAIILSLIISLSVLIAFSYNNTLKNNPELASASSEYAFSWSAIGVLHGFAAAGQDLDKDSLPKNRDNCPEIYNPRQENDDGDKEGDACDWDDVLKGPNEVGVDCGSRAPNRCLQCPICDSLNIAPLRLSAYMDTIDVLFVPGEGYTGPQDREFKEDVRYNIRNVYFKLDKVMERSIFSKSGNKVGLSLPSNYKNKFNFYVSKSPDLAGVNWIGLTSLPDDLENAESWMDVNHVLTTEPGEAAFGLVPIGGLANGLGVPNTLRTLPSAKTSLHELSHVLFSESDKYISDNVPIIGSYPDIYYELMAHGINTWKNKKKCENFAKARGWPKNLCNPLKSVYKYDCFDNSNNQWCVMGNGEGEQSNLGIDYSFSPASAWRVREVIRNWDRYNSFDIGMFMSMMERTALASTGQAAGTQIKLKGLLTEVKVNKDSISFVRNKPVSAFHKYRLCEEDVPCLKVELYSIFDKVISSFEVPDPRLIPGKGWVEEAPVKIFYQLPTYKINAAYLKISDKTNPEKSLKVPLQEKFNEFCQNKMQYDEGFCK
ncbi:hypothetical protein J4437_05295 [Candidatus Woesearchaeota archaeon]|nr:hypothetical protein [Candidatus Woesearchaeota archaeon]